MSQFKSGLKIKINDGKEFLPDVLKLSGNGLTLDQATGEVNIDFSTAGSRINHDIQSVGNTDFLFPNDNGTDGYFKFGALDTTRVLGRNFNVNTDLYVDDSGNWSTSKSEIYHIPVPLYKSSMMIFDISKLQIENHAVVLGEDHTENYVGRTIRIIFKDNSSILYLLDYQSQSLPPSIYHAYSGGEYTQTFSSPLFNPVPNGFVYFAFDETGNFITFSDGVINFSPYPNTSGVETVITDFTDSNEPIYINSHTLISSYNIPGGQSKSWLVDHAANPSLKARNVYNLTNRESTKVNSLIFPDGSSISSASHLGSSEYQLPIASSTTLGGIKIGDNIVVGNDGKISVSEFTPSTDEIIELQSRTQSTLVTDNYIIQSRWDMGTIYVYSKDTRQLVTSFNGGFYPGFLHHTQRSDEIFYIGSSTTNVEFVKRLRISDGQRYNLFTTLTDSDDTYYKNVLCCGMHGSTGVVISNTISGVAILSNNVRSTIDTPEVSYLNRNGYPNNLYSSGIFIEDGASYKAIFPQKMSDSDNLAIVTVTYDGSSHSYHVCNYDIPALELFSIKLINNGTDVRIVYFSNNRYHSVVSSLTSITTESYINKSGVVESTFPPTGNDGIFYNGSVRRVTKSVTGLLNEQTFNKLSTIASSSNLGIISIGNNLDINKDGIVSVPEVNLSINGSSLTVGNPGVLGQDALDTLVTHLSSAASPASNVTTITLESIYEISEPNHNLVPYGVDKSGFAVPVTASYKEKYSVIGFTKPITAARLTDIYQSITDDIYFSQYLIPLTQPLSIINDSEVFGYSTLAEVGLLPTTQLTDIRNNVSQYSTVVIGVGSNIDIIRETSPLIDIGVNTIVGEEGLFINHNLPTAGTIVSIAKISESGKISKAILSEYQHTVTTGDGDVVTIYYPTQVDTVDPTIVTVVKVFNPDFGATTHLINHTNNKDLAAQQPIPNVELITSGVLKLSSSDVNNVRAIIPNLLVGDILYVDTNSYGLTNVPGEISQPVGTFLGNSILVNIQRGIATPVGDEPIKPAIGNSGNTYVPEGLVFDTPIDNGEGSEGGGE